MIETRDLRAGSLLIAVETALMVLVVAAFGGRLVNSLAALAFLQAAVSVPALIAVRDAASTDYQTLRAVLLSLLVSTLFLGLVTHLPSLALLVVYAAIVTLLTRRLYRSPASSSGSPSSVDRWLPLGLWLLLAGGMLTFDHGGSEQHGGWLLAYSNVLTDGFPPGDPFWAGEKLTYHYFYNLLAILMTDLIPVSRVEVLRLVLPVFLLLVSTRSLFALASALSGSRAAAAAAVTSFFAFFGYGPIFYTMFQTASLNISYRLPSLLLALVQFLAILDLLRPREAVSSPRWILFGTLLFGVSGARANVLPLVLCGLALAFALALLRTRSLTKLPKWIAGALAGTTAVFYLSYLLFYSGSILGSNIMEIAPLNDSVTVTSQGQPSPVYVLLSGVLPAKAAVALFIAIVVLVKQMAFAPLALAHVRSLWSWEDESPFDEIVLGVWIAGVSVLALFENLTNEQWAFFYFASLGLTLLVLSRVDFKVPSSSGLRLLMVFTTVLQLTYFGWRMREKVIEIPWFDEQTWTAEADLAELADFVTARGRETWLVNSSSPPLLRVAALSPYARLYVDRQFERAARSLQHPEIERRIELRKQLDCRQLRSLAENAGVDLLVIDRLREARARQRKPRDCLREVLRAGRLRVRELVPEEDVSEVERP